MRLSGSSPGFLRIAGEDLSELHLAGTLSTKDKTLDLQTSLQRFTSLTRLVISDFKSGSVLPRQTVAPVVELVIIGCFNPESMISEPDALTSLRSLHVEVEHCPYEFPYLDDWKDNSEDRKSELQRVATALLSLPKLSQISGRCRLINEYMAEHLLSWKRSKVSSRALNVPGYGSFWMWTKT